MFMNDVHQQALGFLVSQTTYIEPLVYRIKYPELNYADFVPIDHAAGEWAKSYTFYSVDQYGKAEWITANTTDIPLADFTRGKHEAAIEMGGIAYRYNLEELGQAMMIPGLNLTTERANAARRASEEMIHNSMMYGDTPKGWLGLINLTGPDVINVTTTWPAQIALGTAAAVNFITSDVNNAISNIWVSSLGIEFADTVLLPMSAMTLLAITQLPNTTMNLLSWLKANNIYTETTGRPLTIMAVRGLDTAGASGNGRMIVYRKDPEALKAHVPMPLRFFPAYQKTAFVYEVPAMFRFSALGLRLPKTMRYIDGIV